MSKKVDITWYVDDGYVNPGPQKIELYLCDFDGLETEYDVRDAIQDAIYEDFKQSVSFYTDESSVEDAVEEIMAYLKDEDSNEDDEQD